MDIGDSLEAELDRRRSETPTIMPWLVHLICGVHREKNPKGRPVKVGEAQKDEDGALFVTSFRRTGKGSPRAALANGQLVRQGLPVQISWPNGWVNSFDPQVVGIDWEDHKSRLGPSPFGGEEDSQLLEGRLLGVYRCPHELGGDDRKHWIGANDTDELIEWLEQAVERGLRRFPLPPLKPVVPADLRF